MRSFFEVTAAARWPRNDGRLHVYAFANAPVVAMAQGYQRLLDERGVTGLSRQPAAYLHMTIEMIQRHVDELTDGQLRRLGAALAARVGEVPAFDLQVGPALVGYTTVTLDAVPDEPCRQLCEAVRAGAVDALGADAVQPPAGPGRPHFSIGYAIADVDMDPHLGAIHNCRLGRAVLAVDEVHLVAVDQDPAAGVYRWPAPLATLPLGPRPPR